MPDPVAGSPQTPPRIVRSTLKQDHIIETLRQGIIDGSWGPGSRLPTRQELQVRFDVASVTMQRALDRLIADGFVVSRGRRGTFVVDHPPSTSHYALIFPYPRNSDRVRFWTALANEAENLNRGPGHRRISLYHGVDGHTDGEDHDRLVRDLRHERLAGMVFAVNPFSLVDTPILDQPGVPRIAIMDPPSNQWVTAAELDTQSFVAKALDHFRGRRRSQVAVFSVPGMEGGFRERVLDALAARWMVTKPYWWHTIDPSAAMGAKAIAHLLLHRGQHQRPDALLVTDDNLVEHATAGLLAAGVRVPEDVEVVVHCNFPWPTPAVLPVRRLGFDAGELLTRCLDWVDARRAGDTTRTVLIPARFEDELKPR